MTKQKNGYFYSDNQELLDRLYDELVYSGRRVARVKNGIVQFALPKPKPTKAEKAKAERAAKEGKEKNKRPEQKSKRERWMGE